MIRILAAATAVAAASLAGAVSAQTWGQPIYVGPSGHVIGGTPLSEVETRSYVNTGRLADGYGGRVYVHAPAPVYGAGYGHGHARHGDGRYATRPHQGYRDVWGYNDDRPLPARRLSGDRRYRRDHRSDRDCGCADVYLYDR